MNISKDIFNFLFDIFTDVLRQGAEGYDEALEIIKEKYSKYIDDNFNIEKFVDKITKIQK